MKVALVSSSAALLLWSSAAGAAGVTSPTVNPYFGAPVSDSVLAQTTGQGIVPFSVTTRRLADQNTRSFFNEIAEGNRVAMDNWWAQTGAALIAANVRM